nr:integral membrane protein sed5 [Quercus suber]
MRMISSSEMIAYFQWRVYGRSPMGNEAPATEALEVEEESGCALTRVGRRSVSLRGCSESRCDQDTTASQALSQDESRSSRRRIRERAEIITLHLSPSLAAHIRTCCDASSLDCILLWHHLLYHHHRTVVLHRCHAIGHHLRSESHTAMSHLTTDRTPEFRSILIQAQKSLARNRKPGAPNSQPLLTSSQQQDRISTPPTRKQRSEFARNAAQIGRGISATMGKLQRLAELAKRKTLFDDRPVEIQELTYIIKQDLAGLNQSIGTLAQLQRQTQQGTPGQEGEHNKNVVVLLQGKLADVGVNFKEVLEVRTKNIQASRSRQDNFVNSVAANQLQGSTGGDPGRSDSPLYSTPNRGRSPKPPSALQSNSTAQDVLSLDPSSNSSPLYAGNTAQSQQQLQLLEEGSQSNSYISQRGEAIEAIERTIGELGGIFGQLAQMVSEQAEQIQRIDANTDDVVDNVEGAQRELMKYWSRVQGNRWLVAKMFGVLMVFFLLWVLLAAAVTHEAKTALAGQIARACAVFCVDEIIVFDDGQAAVREPEAGGYTAFADPNYFLFHLLSYLETPPHLRRALFPMHPDLRTAGALPSLDMPHHLRGEEWCAFREGVTRGKEGGTQTLVETGLQRRVVVPVELEEGVRVTVRLPETEPEGGEGVLLRAQAVAPDAPRKEKGYYWGYAVRQAGSLGEVFTECPFDGGYDVSVGTSERGVTLDSVLNGHSVAYIAPSWRHLLVVFGGVAGLEAALSADVELRKAGVQKAEEMFDRWVNAVPGQGSRTIRTEEAVWVVLTGLRSVVDARADA